MALSILMNLINSCLIDEKCIFFRFTRKLKFHGTLAKNRYFTADSRHIPQHGILFPLELVFLFKNRKSIILYYLLPIARNEIEENKFNLIIIII